MFCICILELALTIYFNLGLFVYYVCFSAASHLTGPDENRKADYKFYKVFGLNKAIGSFFRDQEDL